MRSTLRAAPVGRRRMHGLTLVEMMVGITIGLVILTVMSLLFANNSRSRTETERVNQRIEAGGYAMELLVAELEHAGFLSVFDPRQLTLPTAKPNPCVTDAASLRAAMGVHIQGYDDTDPGVGCISDVLEGTDVVVTRRALACVAGVGECPALAAGAPGFQASSCNDPLQPELATGVVGNFYRLSTAAADFTLTRRDCTTAAEIRAYVVRIHYVAANDKPGDGIPTLKRAELGAGGFTILSVAQGVENLQLEYGLDTNNDGNPDVYSASPDIYQSCSDTSTPTCVEHWASVVSTKVYLLARNLDGSPAHADAKVYTLGRVADAAGGSGDLKTVGPFADSFKRSVFQQVVRLQNASGRRFSPS